MVVDPSLTCFLKHCKLLRKSHSNVPLLKTTKISLTLSNESPRTSTKYLSVNQRSSINHIPHFWCEFWCWYTFWRSLFEIRVLKQRFDNFDVYFWSWQLIFEFVPNFQKSDRLEIRECPPSKNYESYVKKFFSRNFT